MSDKTNIREQTGENSDSYDWKPMPRSTTLPPLAFQVGGELLGKKYNPMYLVRHSINDEYHIGVMEDPNISKKFQANIIVRSKEVIVRNETVEIFVATPHGYNRLRWVPYSGSLVPKNAISAGKSESKEEKYICRGIYKGNSDRCKIVVPGELLLSKGYCLTYYKEPAYHFDYQILTDQ